MTARLGVVAALLGVAALAAAPGANRQGPNEPRGGPPAFASAGHFDVSPALRDLPPLPPHAGAVHEMRRFRQAVGPASLDTVVQGAPSAPLVPAPSLTFEGIGNVNGVLPPDTNGDVGPNHFVQWVNLSFAIYSKGTASSPPTLLYGPAAGNTLWAGFGGPCESTNNGDPIVRYDHIADRWVMSQLAIPNNFFGILLSPFYQCIAVSTTPDPTGSYYRYQFSFDKLNDYPKFGVWPDAYYMTINQFSAPALQWAGQGVVAFDRASMLAGRPANMVYFDLSSVDINLGGMLPADLDGALPPAGAPGLFMQVDDDAWGYAPDQLQLWRFHVDWANPSGSMFTRAATLPTAPFDSDMCGTSETCIPQAGTTAKLDAMSDRLMYRLQYRNFGDHDALVVNHTVDVDGTDHAGIRWYEVRDPEGTPSLYQQGTYAPDADHRWMGSAAMDSAGNLAIGFSVSGTTTSPSIRYAGRLATDPPGTLAQGETTLMAGSGAQTNTSGRWGDYSMLVVDPSDDCTFWYTQQYYAATSDAGWQTRVGTFSFPTCTPPSSTLPRVTVAATVATAAESPTTNGTFTISRTGDTSAPLTVTCTTGGTATAGSDYEPLSGSMTIAAGSSTAIITVAPIDDPLVEPNETVILTISPDAAYVVGSPGTALVTITSDDLPSDLVVAALTAPSVAGANTAITVTDTTRNQGGGSSAASTTAFYLSTDPTLSTNDALIGTRAVPALAVGASDSGTAMLTIPSGTAIGTYYVIAKADGDNTVMESVETNNTRWSTVSIGPDLIVSALGGPATGAAGGSIAITDTTTNRGGDTAAASTTSFYLSANFLLDANDIALGGRVVPSLAAGASSTATTAVTIPAGTAAGTYYIVAAADAGKTVTETQEANNQRFGSMLRIGADLVIGSVTGPATAAAGGVIVVGDTTTNQGAGDAQTSTTGFYLSANGVFDGSDVFLGSRSVPALVAGASSSASTSLTIPPGTATGSYYLLANADNTNAVVESTESNNARLGSVLRIGPDLTQVSTTAPATAAAGGTIVVGDTTKNQGAGAAGASTTAIYLSTGVSLGASSVLLGTHDVPPLAAGATSTASTSVTLPTTLATGNYYVIATADSNGQIAETSESNNASFGVLVRVGPDLVVSSLTVPTSAIAGTPLSVSVTTLNQGAGASPTTTTRFYLSTNFTLDAADVSIGTRAVGALGASQSDTGAATIVIPAGTPVGTYYVIAAADGDATVSETSESNNTRAATIRISS